MNFKEEKNKMKLVYLHRILGAISVSKRPSYFPECSRKGFLKRVLENIKWVNKYHEYNRFYNLYALDLKESGDVFNTNFCDYDDNFRLVREKGNKNGDPNSQIYLLRDKLQFYRYLRDNNIPTPEVIAFIKNNIIYDVNLKKVTLDYLKQYDIFFVKDNNGECASYVKKFTVKDDLNELLSLKGEFICQLPVTQDLHLGELNKNAINTIRMVTMRNSFGVVTVLSAVLRVGTSKTGNVDNWAKGGLSIGIEEDGTLKKYGYYKPSYGTKTDVHPDSKIVFEKFKINDYEKIKNLAIKAHEIFYDVQSIGWDIAISDEGPTFIEGNDNWEISLLQCCNGGLKKQWLEGIK